jgi:hypothetical protein
MNALPALLVSRRAGSEEGRRRDLPGGKSESMALLGVSKAGALSLLSTVKTARGAHCVAADDHHQAWVCDPDHDQLLLVDDTHPKTE